MTANNKSTNHCYTFTCLISCVLHWYLSKKYFLLYKWQNKKCTYVSLPKKEPMYSFDFFVFTCKAIKTHQTDVPIMIKQSQWLDTKIGGSGLAENGCGFGKVVVADEHGLQWVGRTWRISLRIKCKMSPSLAPTYILRRTLQCINYQ